MVDRNDGLFREVEEELRRERVAKLWDKYGVMVIAAAAALVLGVGGYQFMTGRAKTAAEQAGAEFQSALKAKTAKKPDDATKALEKLAAGSAAGYAALARLQLASEQLEAGKRAEAVATFDALGADAAADPVLRDFAKLQAASTRVGEADWTEMENRLSPLMVEANPWNVAALEIWGIAAQKAGKLDEARRKFEQVLADPRTPPEMDERVRALMSTVVAQELAANPKPAATTSGATLASPPAETKSNP